MGFEQVPGILTEFFKTLGIVDRVLLFLLSMMEDDSCLLRGSLIFKLSMIWHNSVDSGLAVLGELLLLLLLLFGDAGINDFESWLIRRTEPFGQ